MCRDLEESFHCLPEGLLSYLHFLSEHSNFQASQVNLPAATEQNFLITQVQNVQILHVFKEFLCKGQLGNYNRKNEMNT